jgi:hypothetical protein
MEMYHMVGSVHFASVTTRRMCSGLTIHPRKIESEKNRSEPSLLPVSPHVSWKSMPIV